LLSESSLAQTTFVPSRKAESQLPLGGTRDSGLQSPDPVLASSAITARSPTKRAALHVGPLRGRTRSRTANLSLTQHHCGIQGWQQADCDYQGHTKNGSQNNLAPAMISHYMGAVMKPIDIGLIQARWKKILDQIEGHRKAIAALEAEANELEIAERVARGEREPTRPNYPPTISASSRP